MLAKYSHKSRKLVVPLLALGITLSALPAIAPVHADTYFPQTTSNLWGPFEAYWNTHGGVGQFGMPRTNVFPTKDGYDAQYFERAQLTYNPRNADPYKVQLQLLGSLSTANRKAEAPFKPTPAPANAQAGIWFPETQHNLTGKFLDYWRTHGGLPIYGFPISEAFTEKSRSDGKQYVVQYFERNRFELHPEAAGTPYEVQLGLLGSELLDAQGGPSAFANLGNLIAYPPPTKAGVVAPPGGVIQPPGAPGGGGNVTIPDAPALPATTSIVVFTDTYSSPDISAYQPLAPLAPTGASPSSWRIAGGRLEQLGIAAQEGTDESAVLVTRDRSYSNFTMNSYYYATSGEPLGVVFRYSDSGFYMLRLNTTGVAPNEAKAVLYRVSGGRATEVVSSRSWAGYTPARWQRITVSASGPDIKVGIDGVNILQASDTKFSTGGVGFYAYADGSAKFDNLRVSR